MRKGIFLLCLLAQIANAQHKTQSKTLTHKTAFCTVKDIKDNSNGGAFYNIDSAAFYDHSTGDIVEWRWNFHGAKDSLLSYKKFRRVVHAKWNKNGKYVVELTTVDKSGSEQTLGVYVYLSSFEDKTKENKKPKEYLSLFASHTTEYLIPIVREKKNEIFSGEMIGVTMKPHSNWTANITAGLFLENNIPRPMIKNMSGLYLNIMLPILSDRVMMGPVVRFGTYNDSLNKGFLRVFGLQANYLSKKSLTPKAPFDLRFEVNSSLNLFENYISGCIMFSLRGFWR